MAKRREFGNIVKRDNGKWLCRWTDVRGKPTSKMITGTRKDAEAFLDSVKTQMYGADLDVTYEEYWEQVVMPQIETLEDKTRYEYIRLWNRNLAPALNKRIVASTSYRFAQSVIDGIEAPSVQRHAARLWSKVCNMAVRDGILQANPIQRMVFKQHEKRDKVILEHDEVIRYIESIINTNYAHLVILEMCAGLRHEEACALRGDDVEFRDGVAYATIDKARVSIGGNIIDKAAKNAYSVRTLPICGIVADMLKSCIIRRMNPRTSSDNFRKWCSRNDVKYIPFGQMRSNFATHACECCNGSLVDMYMGHSGTSTTDKWYRQSTESGMMIVAEAYARYISNE